jgi:hypothetical protein
MRLVLRFTTDRIYTAEAEFCCKPKTAALSPVFVIAKLAFVVPPPVRAMAVIRLRSTLPVTGLMTLKLPTPGPPFGMTATDAAGACDAKIQLTVIPRTARIVPPFVMLARRLSHLCYNGQVLPELRQS